MTCVQTISLGAYVLGALDASDRLETEDHLRDCERCREELVRLAPLPGLLAQVSIDELETPLDDAWLEPGPTRPVPTEPAPRRRLRGLATAAAVGAVLVGVGLAGPVVVDYAPTEPTATTWSTAADSNGVEATAALTDRGWGTDIELTLAELPARQRCRLIVWSEDGRVETAGWWATGYASSVDVPASTSIDLAAIDRMEVRAGDRVLAVLLP